MPLHTNFNILIFLYVWGWSARKGFRGEFKTSKDHFEDLGLDERIILKCMLCTGGGELDSRCLRTKTDKQLALVSIEMNLCIPSNEKNVLSGRGTSSFWKRILLHGISWLLICHKASVMSHRCYVGAFDRGIKITNTWSKQQAVHNHLTKPNSKGKVRPRTSHEGPEGEQLYLYSFFNLGARWGWVVTTPRLL
jgi:hypothetical protein